MPDWVYVDYPSCRETTAVAHLNQQMDRGIDTKTSPRFHGARGIDPDVYVVCMYDVLHVILSTLQVVPPLPSRSRRDE
jgi:hypothetical protein